MKSSIESVIAPTSSRLRVGEPICLFYQHEETLPICYKRGVHYVTYVSENASLWIQRGKQLFAKLEPGQAYFGYVCGTDDSESTTTAGSEWITEMRFAVFVMVFVKNEPSLLRLFDQNEGIHQIIDVDAELLVNANGEVSSLAFLRKPWLKP